MLIVSSELGDAGCCLLIIVINTLPLAIAIETIYIYTAAIQPGFRYELATTLLVRSYAAGTSVAIARRRVRIPFMQPCYSFRK